MEELNLFKAGDGHRGTFNFSSSASLLSDWIEIDKVNQILPDKLKAAGFVEGYCSLYPDGGPGSPTPMRHNVDTHKILYKTTLIEQPEEENECDHTVECGLRFLGVGPIIKAIIYSKEDCPKCKDE